jgi:tRNA (cytidine/uridine-2'-O-)-methyltransferase|tara:strand:- start:303 stop:779 length:477 start_codon:yes stop_codon:yes gene_type:complete
MNKLVQSKMKVVLVEPEIPFNTGSIGRTCVALDLELILIGKLGFSLDSSSVNRAGTRYWKFVQIDHYVSWDEFLEKRSPVENQLYFFEEHGSQSFYSPTYHPESYLIFGCESKGLPKVILESISERTFYLPMKNEAVKSLNLSNAATAVIYQAMREYL